MKKSLTSKLKQLSQWCEKHLQLNNFKEVKFADNDSDSENDDMLSDSHDETSLLGKTSEAMRELKHALRQSKCIIAGKFNKLREKSEGIQQELNREKASKDQLLEEVRGVKIGVTKQEQEITDILKQNDTFK